MNYEKHIYWLEKDQFFELKSFFESGGIKIFHSKKAVCIPLSRRVEFAYISPEEFTQNPICKRQLSWYKVSCYKNKYLVISSKDIKGLGFNVKTLAHLTFKESNFVPEKLCDKTSLKQLIAQDTYNRIKPEEWEDIDRDMEFQKKWLKIIGLRKITFSELFLYHCANHANFIDPMFYELQNQKKVPYSIAGTKYVCSCCLEVYDIIGTDFCKKLVVPCPGAVMFAGLKKDKYYEVLKIKSFSQGETK